MKQVHMKTRRVATLLLASLVALCLPASAAEMRKMDVPIAYGSTNLNRYNVAWDSPSKDSLDSMPLSGRLSAGANVWVQDGSIWLYLGHNGAYDEQGRLLKLGCVRVTPVDFKLGEAGFRQELDLASGTILIQQGDFKASLWFAGETLVLESTSAQPRPLAVAFGSWRDQKRDGIRCDMMGAKGSFSPDRIQADTNGFVWFHRNADFPVDVVQKAKSQGIAAEAALDATTKRVFGGAIVVEGGLSEPAESDAQWQFWEGKAWTGRTHGRKHRQSRCGSARSRTRIRSSGPPRPKPCWPLPPAKPRSLRS